MQKKKIMAEAPGAVPEVVEFIDARDALDEFKAEHADVFAQLEALTERYNTALEQAGKVCRAKEVRCGPFDLYQFTTKYDAKALFKAVGRDLFLKVGGKVGTTTTYEVDRGQLEANIAQNKIPEDVVQLVRKETPMFHAPKPVVLP